MKKFLGLAFIIIILGVMIYAKQKTNIVGEGAQLTKVSGEFSFTEGPASDSEGNVYFTDQPNDRIVKWAIDGTLSIFMDNCGRSNGLYFDLEGNLLACADENNQIWSINTKTKKHTIILENFDEKFLNGPNDLWVDDNGGIYFTDPFYKRPYWTDSARTAIKENVYYLSPDRKSVKVVEDRIVKPNGIIGTADGKILYIADIGDSKTYYYHIEDDGSLSKRALFCNMGSDGMTIDNRGNVYLTGKGVTVFSPKGEQVEHIDVNEKWTANVTFGGKDRDMLFITASKSVYTLKMNVQGVR